MRLKLQLPAKAGRFHIFECEAVRLVTLPDEEFQDFLNGPHQDGRWAAEPFYADEHGRRIYQGVLVLGEGHKDGVFAYDGGKHFAYLPGARAVVDSILEQAVEKIIREGAENTNEGSWCYYFSELYEQMGLVIEDGNGFDTMLLEKLEQRPEAADVTLTDECFDVCYYLDYCKNLAPEQPAPSLSAERKEEIISGILNYMAEYFDDSSLYREYSRLLGIDSIDEYIRYGGTLRAGELAFDDEDVNAQDASFRDDESTRRYIDTAICKNIQHSLACYGSGGHFRHLYSLYEAGELTSAINRIIEDMNHRFLISVLTDDFLSHDLRLTAANLRKERDPEKRTEALDAIDTEAVTRRLMELLDIRNKEEQSIGITTAHIIEIKQYLAALELIVDCPIESADPGIEPVEHILFTQPGMRYCQAQALVHSLLKDEQFSALSEYDKTQITGRILEEVRGRMMEDIVLLETMKAADKDHRVFKLQFEAGEFDMVIYDQKENSCEIFEIKHSSKQVPLQYRHLVDEDKCQRTERRFGPIQGRYILYRGEDVQMENGVQYWNVENYLKALPTLDIVQAQETGTQSIEPTL